MNEMEMKSLMVRWLTELDRAEIKGAVPRSIMWRRSIWRRARDPDPGRCADGRLRVENRLVSFCVLGV